MKRVCSLCLSLVLAFVLTCPALAAVTYSYSSDDVSDDDLPRIGGGDSHRT